MRRPQDGAWKWDTQANETTVTISGGPAHILGLDPGERVCSCDRGEECDRLSAQVKNQAEHNLALVQENRELKRNYKAILADATRVYEAEISPWTRQMMHDIIALLTDAPDGKGEKA